MRRVVKSQVGAGVSAWIPVDRLIDYFAVGLAAVVTGTVNYTIEVTYDDIFDSTVTPTAFNIPNNANLVAATTTQQGSLIVPIAAIRINQASGSGTTTLTVLPSGVDL